jgi:hypothetical protein
MDKDDLLWGLIEAGHNAIFAWEAGYVAAGIALIQVVTETLKIHTISYSLGFFCFVYSLLILFMTFSIYSIFKIMHQQNDWASQFPSGLADIYFSSRSALSNKIVGKTLVKTNSEKIILILHFVLLIVFLALILYFDIKPLTSSKSYFYSLLPFPS